MSVRIDNVVFPPGVNSHNLVCLSMEEADSRYVRAEASIKLP